MRRATHQYLAGWRGERLRLMARAFFGMERVDRVLRRLESYRTVSRFSRMFYRLIYEWLPPSGEEGAALRRAFQLFLRNEVRRHNAVMQMIRQGQLDIKAILRVSNTTRRTLGWVHNILSRMRIEGTQEQMVRELLVAECCFHLGLTRDVLDALHRAVTLGGRHPLVFFALGYNTYSEAVERFTVRGPGKGRMVVQDAEAFERMGQEAMALFREGLGHDSFDAQIHWWMGRICESLGDVGSAEASYRLAMETDPENFTTAVMNKLKDVSALRGRLRSPEETERLSGLPPITDEDLQEARRELSEDTWPPG